MKVIHSENVAVLDYPFHQKLQEDLLPLIRNHHFQDVGHTNVKAKHTEWDWQQNHSQVIKFKAWILNEVRKEFGKFACIGEKEDKLEVVNFWANIYNKGDYAVPHMHLPCYVSFAYFLKSKWYHPSLVFSHHGESVRPKDGRIVIFPSWVYHHVRKHRFAEQRITLSGNVAILKDWENPDPYLLKNGLTGPRGAYGPL